MRCSVVFAGPREVRIEETPVPEPGAGEVLVATTLSAISAGTEMLVYRDQFPHDLSVDMAIEGMGDKFSYPLQYGYAAVGRVISCGEDVGPGWLDRLVFAFAPHTSHFVTPLSTLIPVPDGVTADRAAFLPNMETAVNLVQDGAPVLGERVVVFGQGVVGLLTTMLLAEFPLSQLVTVDKYENRREASLAAGAHKSLTLDALDQLAESPATGGADLVYELSGSPITLNHAISVTRYGGRIVIGSWYGQKQVPLDLGGRFHRDRIQLISSQVSSIAPELRGRWDKARRLETAWRMLRQVGAERWITHRFPIAQAPEAYQLLDQHPSEALQVVLTYDSP
jgi:2-desacetyl-2-hydroxyethyl bacteriochlorophyllide A dehydrogenase